MSAARIRLSLLITAFLAGVPGCGAPTVPEAGKVPDLDAFGVDAAPLVTDWVQAQRADLESAMAKGIAVVRYDHTGLRVLRDCRLPGSYGFMPATPSEQLVRLENGRELGANLPTTAGRLSSKLGREFGSTTTLDIGYVTVGKRLAGRQSGRRSLVRGDKCEGATHFVSAVWVGGYGMQPGERGKKPTMRELFGVKADEEGTRAQHGTLDACRNSSGSPSPSCNTTIRLELRSLDTEEHDSRTVPCPRGMASAGGKCSATASLAECKSDDVSECENACGKGDGPSCEHAAVLYSRGAKVSRDFAKARKLSEQGCKDGSQEACTELGLLLAHAQGGPRDTKPAIALFEKACQSGVVRACFHHAELYDVGPGVEREPPRAALLYEQPCHAGYARACSGLASLIEDGMGMEKDLAKALQLYEGACDNGDARGCFGQARALGEGRGTTKNPERAKDLLDQSCSDGEPEACMLLGDWYADGEIIRKDNLRAMGAYQRGGTIRREQCETGDGSACDDLALQLVQGKGVPKDDKLALELHEKSCELGELSGCVHAGERAEKGRGIGKAELMYRKACDAGYGPGCGHLGAFYRVGVGVERDTDKAFELFQKGCSLFDVSACVNLAYCFEHGIGTQEDLQRAFVLYEASCGRDSAVACSNLGWMYASGKPVDTDMRKAAELYARACKAGLAPSCSFLAELYERGEGVPRDVGAAAALHRRACENNHLRGCSQLVRMIETKEVSLSRSAMEAIYQKGCEQGDQSTCTALGMHVEEADPVRAYTLYKKACEADHGMACQRLGRMYETGTFVGKNLKEAVRLYEEGCSLGAAGACSQLGAMYEKGDGGLKKDPKAAFRLYERGCRGGDGLACHNLAEMYRKGVEGKAPDNKKAVDYFEEACSYGYANGCFHVGESLAKQGKKDEEPRAFFMYLRACIGDDAEGCLALADCYDKGKLGMKKDADRAKMFKERACQSGDKKSCDKKNDKKK